MLFLLLLLFSSWEWGGGYVIFHFSTPKPRYTCFKDLTRKRIKIWKNISVFVKPNWKEFNELYNLYICTSYLIVFGGLKKKGLNLYDRTLLFDPSVVFIQICVYFICTEGRKEIAGVLVRVSYRRGGVACWRSLSWRKLGIKTKQ